MRQHCWLQNRITQLDIAKVSLLHKFHEILGLFIPKIGLDENWMRQPRI
jgi:hypothetical protein